MKPVCFLCQEFETDIGHETILCPKQFCKICQQRGHFAMNCKTFCKAFVIKDEQLVKLENEDETKTENHFNDLPCKVEPKAKSYIAVKKELIKTENENCDEFSKSEEEAFMYCLESMSPKDTKKRKVDSDLPVEKDLPSLEEVQQKLIEKLNILNQLHQSEIKDLRQRLSKNALIIGKKSIELKTLSENKRGYDIELSNVYHSSSTKSLESSELPSLEESQQKIIEKLSNDLVNLSESKRKMEIELNDKVQSNLKVLLKYQSEITDLKERLSKNALIIECLDKKESRVKNSQLKRYQSKIIEQSKDLKILYEDIVELNDKLQGKDRKIQLLQAQWNLENFKLNDTIRRLKKEIELLSKSKDKMELELNSELNKTVTATVLELQSKETEIKKCQNQVEVALEMKAWASGVQKKIIEKLSKDLQILRESKEKFE